MSNLVKDDAKTDAKADAKADAKTTELQKTPPHGMKGALGPSDTITPKPFLVGACVVLLVALFAAMVMFLIDWQRRRRMKRGNETSKVLDPTAWARLRASISLIRVPELEPADSMNQTEESLEWNHFSSEVSLCLRRALEIRTGWPLAESTTEEILALLSKRQVQLEVLTELELQQILGRMDRVRFGGHRISCDEGSKILSDLVDWCHRLEQGVPSVTNVAIDQKKPAIPGPIIEKGELRVFDK